MRRWRGGVRAGPSQGGLPMRAQQAAAAWPGPGRWLHSSLQPEDPPYPHTPRTPAACTPSTHAGPCSPPLRPLHQALRAPSHLRTCTHNPCCACCAEYLEVMKDKDLVLRTDVFEVLLAQLEAQQGAEAGGGSAAGAAGG